MTIKTPMASPQFLPTISIIIGGMMWGLYWIPLHALEDAGLNGAWPAIAVYSGLCIILVPYLIANPGTLPRQHLPKLAWCGLFTGTAFAFYSISLGLTEVIRSILLFYLTPVWSTALGVLFLGEKISASRIISIILGLLGLVVVLGLGEFVPWPRNLGDWLALLSGMAWAYGSYCMYKLPNSGTMAQISMFVFGGLAVSIAAAFLWGPQYGGISNNVTISGALPIIGLSVLFLFPMLFLTLWPMMTLSPGRVGLLLMGEVLVGVISAAWLSGDPFGTRELIGATLIVGAGVVEVTSKNS